MRNLRSFLNIALLTKFYQPIHAADLRGENDGITIAPNSTATSTPTPTTTFSYQTCAIDPVYLGLFSNSLIQYDASTFCLSLLGSTTITSCLTTNIIRQTAAPITIVTETRTDTTTVPSSTVTVVSTATVFDLAPTSSSSGAISRLSARAYPPARRAFLNETLEDARSSLSSACACNPTLSAITDNIVCSVTTTISQTTLLRTFAAILITSTSGITTITRTLSSTSSISPTVTLTTTSISGYSSDAPCAVDEDSEEWEPWQEWQQWQSSRTATVPTSQVSVTLTSDPAWQEWQQSQSSKTATSSTSIASLGSSLDPAWQPWQSSKSTTMSVSSVIVTSTVDPNWHQWRQWHSSSTTTDWQQWTQPSSSKTIPSSIATPTIIPSGCPYNNGTLFKENADNCTHYIRICARSYIEIDFLPFVTGYDTPEQCTSLCDALNRGSNKSCLGIVWTTANDTHANCRILRSLTLPIETNDAITLLITDLADPACDPKVTGILTTTASIGASTTSISTMTMPSWTSKSTSTTSRYTSSLSDMSMIMRTTAATTSSVGGPISSLTPTPLSTDTCSLLTATVTVTKTTSNQPSWYPWG